MNICFRYVWEHLEVGYMQGMCDLVAPLLVIFDDESITYSCFCLLMERMGANFPHNGGAMDTHFSNMRYGKTCKIHSHNVSAFFMFVTWILTGNFNTIQIHKIWK